MKEHDEVLRQAAIRDTKFVTWVDMVHPGSTNDIQKVWLPELIMLLRLLWDIYQWLKGKGWIKYIRVTWKVSRALRLKSEMEQEIALKKVKEEFQIK